MDCPYCERPYLIVTSDTRKVRVEITHRFGCKITDAEDTELKRALLALQLQEVM